MKKKFSIKWVASSQPRKQRKYRANAPLHKRRSMMSAHLSKTLRMQYKKRSLPIRKGDTVRVMRGENRDHKGKVEAVDLNRLKIRVEGVDAKRVSGETKPAYIDPSNVQLIELTMEDVRRRKFVKRKEGKDEEMRK